MWTAQLPHEPDLLVTLAIVQREAPDIKIQVEHPMAMAQRALTVNLISGVRLTLGLGLSHRAVTERVWGVPWDRPIRRMGEYLDVCVPRTMSPSLISAFAAGRPEHQGSGEAQHDRWLWPSDSPT